MPNIPIATGLEFARWLELELHGLAHVALAGSVLLAGKSKNDLDVIVYPHRGSTSREECAARIAELFPNAKNLWGEDMPYPPDRLIYRVELDGLTIEFFFLA